jgi:hypothetical protein
MNKNNGFTRLIITNETINRLNICISTDYAIIGCATHNETSYVGIICQLYIF